jgi:hypothetical protein
VVDPTADLTVEENETVWLAVLPGSGARQGVPRHAWGTIAYDDALQVSQLAVQDGTVQRSLVTRLRVWFNAEVTLGAQAFELRNRDTGAVVTTSFTQQVVNGQTEVTLRIEGGASVQARKTDYTLVDGNYELTIRSAEVRYGELTLDGDGQGGNYVLGAREADNFYRLFGDVVGLDRLVGIPDYNAFRSAFGSSVGSAKYRGELDYDGDGVIGIPDFNQFRSRFGKRLKF